MQSIKMSDELLSDLQTALFGSTNLSWFRDVSGQHFMELPGYDHLCQENSIFFPGKRGFLWQGKQSLKIKGIFYAENHNAGFENTRFKTKFFESHA